MPHWRDHLNNYNDGKPALFSDQFLERWGDQPWPPHGDAQFADDFNAAAKLHIQLVSRITTQRLPYADGVEAAALKSVYQLFGEARDIFKAHPKSQLTEAIAWEVLNEHVRPFTAKWHRQSERGALAAIDATDIFRDELSALQEKLVRFDSLLIEIRDGAAPKPVAGKRESDRDKRITAEMATPLGWGIDPRLGGLPGETATAINQKEHEAVRARRKHYHERNTEILTSRTEAPAQATPAVPPNAPTDAGSSPHYQEAWRERPHATALAISGGGIRSATFALGVLVALARRNLLFQFDYLSTVSGGGYVGSFLTSFLNSPKANSPTPAGQQKPRIGLLRSDLPFRREDGEAAALRHVRHHSKYLATGRLWERLQMTFTQVYGMAWHGLGFVYLAFVAALFEYLLRGILGSASLWPIALGVLAATAIASSFASMMMRRRPAIQKFTDAAMTLASVAFILVLLWLAFNELREFANNNPLIFLGATALPLLASAVLVLGVNVPAPIRIVLAVLSVVAAPALFLGLELFSYKFLESCGWIFGVVAALAGLLFFWWVLDINFTAPHQHYKRKLGEAYLVQPDAGDKVTALLRQNVSLRLSECASESSGKARGPFHLVNCALNVPASGNPAMQGRLTDFFLFSPSYCGSPLIGYQPTTVWEGLDRNLDLGTAMAISGAAAAPQMGTGTTRNFSFLLALFNVRLGYWLRNPMIKRYLPVGPPGLSYLLQEMFGWASETRPYVNLSDGGHIENLAVYELLRRRCKYIVAIDGEEDAQMTFHGLTTLQRLAFIDLGVTIDIGVDSLRLGDKGLSHSHFAFCRIRYPTDSRDGDASYGYLIYLKLSLTGNEGEFIRRYRLDEPAFPHHSTADQFFTEAQFEAYRSLGEHIGDKMFLPAIVSPAIASSKDVNLEQWFHEIGKSMLEPLETRSAGGRAGPLPSSP